MARMTSSGVLVLLVATLFLAFSGVSSSTADATSQCTKVPPPSWIRRPPPPGTSPPAPVVSPSPSETPTPTTTTASPTPTPVPGSACPDGMIPSDTGCCKEICEVQCSETFSEFKGIVTPPTTPSRNVTPSCTQQRVCTHVWGDPHIVMADFQFDPMWYGWMLLTQIDGLKLFAHARQVVATSAPVTSQDKFLIVYGTSVLLVEHLGWESGWGLAYMAVKGMDLSLESDGTTSTGGAIKTNNLQSIPLNKEQASATLGWGTDSELTITRKSDDVFQVCTAGGDTFKIVMKKSISLDIWVCLSPTCNLRATGFLGIHGAEHKKRFPLPNSTDSKGEVPYNRSPYAKVYLEAWYAETNRQLAGIYPSRHPAFPQVETQKCAAAQDAAAQVGNTPSPAISSDCNCADRRYCVCELASSPTYNKTQEFAAEFCAQVGGYLASIRTADDQAQVRADLQAQGFGPTPSGGKIITGGAIPNTADRYVADFMWKFGPPTVVGTSISRGLGTTGAATTLSCQQGSDNCFWMVSNPSAGTGTTRFLLLSSVSTTYLNWTNFGHTSQKPYSHALCEFVKNPPAATPSPPAAMKKESDRLVAALKSADLEVTAPEMTLQRSTAGEGTINCTEVLQVDCVAMGCPQKIFTENSGQAEQCAYATEWIAAKRYNDLLSDVSVRRIPLDDLVSATAWSKLSSSNFSSSTDGSSSSSNNLVCPENSTFCESCGDGCAPRCFPCNSTCPSETTLSVNTDLGVCICELAAVTTLPPSEEESSLLWLIPVILGALLVLLALGLIIRKVTYRDQKGAAYQDNTKYTKGFQVNANPDECELAIPALARDNGGNGDPVGNRYGAPARGRVKIPDADPRAINQDLDEEPPSAPDVNEEEDLLGGPKVFFENLGEPNSSEKPVEIHASAEGKWKQNQTVDPNTGEVVSTAQPELIDTTADGNDASKKDQLHSDVQRRLLDDAASKKQEATQPKPGDVEL